MPNVSLTKHQEQFIHKKVKSGRYLSASELVREALRLLEEAERLRDERLAALTSDIAVATRQLKQGRAVDGAAAFRTARQRIHKKKAAS